MLAEKAECAVTIDKPYWDCGVAGRPQTVHQGASLPFPFPYS